MLISVQIVGHPRPSTLKEIIPKLLSNVINFDALVLYNLTHRYRATVSNELLTSVIVHMIERALQPLLIVKVALTCSTILHFCLQQ